MPARSLPSASTWGTSSGSGVPAPAPLSRTDWEHVNRRQRPRTLHARDHGKCDVRRFYKRAVPPNEGLGSPVGRRPPSPTLSIAQRARACSTNSRSGWPFCCPRRLPAETRGTMLIAREEIHCDVRRIVRSVIPSAVWCTSAADRPPPQYSRPCSCRRSSGDFRAHDRCRAGRLSRRGRSFCARSQTEERRVVLPEAGRRRQRRLNPSCRRARDVAHHSVEHLAAALVGVEALIEVGRGESGRSADTPSAYTYFTARVNQACASTSGGIAHQRQSNPLMGGSPHR